MCIYFLGLCGRVLYLKCKPTPLYPNFVVLKVLAKPLIKFFHECHVTFRLVCWLKFFSLGSLGEYSKKAYSERLFIKTGTILVQLLLCLHFVICQMCFSN